MRRSKNGWLIASRFFACTERLARTISARLFRAGEFRPGRETFVVFQRLFRQFNGLLKLRIVALDDQIRALRHDIIRIHAVIFDNPPVFVSPGIKSHGRGGDESSIPQWRTSIDANKSAPCPRTNNRPNLLEAEEPREQIAART